MFELFPPPLGSRIIGRYELLAPLRGEGPVSTFLAEDARTGKRCAVSLFDPGIVEAIAWAEFARLVAAAAGVPGIRLPPSVPTKPPEPPHVVEESPEHRGLDRLLAQEGRIPWQRAMAIGARIAGVLDGVVAATGVAHRCLTPSRCTIDARDEVEVLDYGVAEIELAGETGDELAYRAPEQREGKGGVLSDVFALATIIHELIAGTTLSGSSALGHAPAAVGQLLARALARDPEQRPANLADFHDALLAATAPEAASPVARPSAELRPVMPATDPPVVPSPAARAPVREDRLAVAPVVLASPMWSSLGGASRQPRALEPLAPMPSRPLLAPATPLDERTELLSGLSPPPDSTLVLPGSTEPSTEKLPGASKLVARHGAAPGGRASPVPAVKQHVGSEDALEDRTVALGQRSRIGTPHEERTEIAPSQPARGGARGIGRPEKLAASPAHADDLDDRTEIFRKTTPGPKPNGAPAAAEAPPKSPETREEERTQVVSSQWRAVARTEPTARPSAPSVVIGSAREPVSAEGERRDGPRPTSGSPERARMAVLVAVGLGLATLIGLGLWLLS